MSEAASQIDSWKAHVLQCGLCANAKALGDLCPIGRNFWKPSDIIGQAQAAAAEMPPPPPPTMIHVAAIDPHTSAQLANMVASRVIARSSDGSAIAVPMEKTSRAVEIRTSADVMLRMPERDIEVYAEMKDSIFRLLGMAQLISTAVGVTEETKNLMKSTPSTASASDGEVALVVRQARSHFGIGSDEALYQEFSNLTRRMLRLGDRLGNFMRVDETTQRIMRVARMLAIEMQGEIERSMSQVLKLDEETRRLVRKMRMFAIDLQGEIERRVGT
jgi:hypothetical protein